MRGRYDVVSVAAFGYSYVEAFALWLSWGMGVKTYAKAARPAVPATAAKSFFLRNIGSGKKPAQSFSTWP
jgi:hypothetical protein